MRLTSVVCSIAHSPAKQPQKSSSGVESVMSMFGFIINSLDNFNGMETINNRQISIKHVCHIYDANLVIFCICSISINNGILTNT